MQFLNEVLEGAIEVILNKEREKLFSKVKIDIGYEEIEKIVRDKNFYIVSRITDILSDDTDDFEAVEKIVCLLEENNISCGGRHDF